MNRVPRCLKSEPLIEAIWQAQFESPVNQPIGELLPGMLYSALRGKYPRMQLHRLPTADIPAPVAQFDPNLKFAAKYRMEEPNGQFLFQVGDRVITLNAKRPYAGWKGFNQEILELIGIAESSGLVPQPSQHSLRYIDLLNLEPAPSLASMQIRLKIGTLEVKNYPLQMRVELSDGKYTHIVQIATPVEAQLVEGIQKGSVVDLETYSTAPAQNWEEVRSQLDMLHDKSKQFFFEQILTADAIKQLVPEY